MLQNKHEKNSIIKMSKLFAQTRKFQNIYEKNVYCEKTSWILKIIGIQINFSSTSHELFEILSCRYIENWSSWQGTVLGALEWKDPQAFRLGGCDPHFLSHKQTAWAN